MRRRDSRKMETAVLFFHPNIVTRPESVSFMATADNTIRRFLEIRCHLFDRLRQQLDATWDQVDDGDHYTLDVDGSNSSSITTTDELIQHMLACTHPYCLERPNMTCHPIKRFLYEPLLKLFYDDDHHHELVVFPRLFRALHSHHFHSSFDMQPLCKRLCHWMSMMMGDFHGAETAAYTQKILPVLQPGGLPNMPSLAQLANAKIPIRVLTRDDDDDDQQEEEGDSGIHVDDQKGVGIRRISLYDLRYSYSDFRQNDIPHTENAYELAFSTSMVKLARLIPDEASFKLACRHEILVPHELLIDFQWWRDNVLRNAEYYERESPYFWPIEQLQKTLDHLNELFTSKMTGGGVPSLLLKGHLQGIDKEAVLFFHPTANTHRNALSWPTLEICASKQRLDPTALLCYQRRHDLAELYDQLEHVIRDVDKSSMRTDNNNISVTDLVEYAEGGSTQLNNQLEQCTTFPIKPFMKLFSLYPTRCIWILENISRRLSKMQQPAYCMQLQAIFRHLIGDLFGTVPANYAFDMGEWDSTHGNNAHRNSLYTLASPVDHVPSLHQFVNQGGFTIIPRDDAVEGGIQVQDGNTIHIQRVSLLDIRLSEHSFSSSTKDAPSSSLEGYFADAMLKLAVLIPDAASFTLATTLGIIREMLFIDWPWWEAHVIRLRLFYSTRYTIGWGTYHVLQDLKRAYMERKKSIASQWPLQAALEALDAQSKLAVRFFHPSPSDICIPSSMASAGMANDPTQHARILFEQRQIDLHDLLHAINLNDSYYWKKNNAINHNNNNIEEGFSFIIDLACMKSTIAASTKTVLQQDWKRYDIEPLLILFSDRAPYSKLCRIRRWIKDNSTLAENLHYFDDMARVLSGNLYSTLPNDWITGTTIITDYQPMKIKSKGSANKEMRVIRNQQQQQWMPSLDEWNKAGFRIESEQKVEFHGVAIDIRRQTLCVQVVSLLDIRYSWQHFQDDSNFYNAVGKPRDDHTHAFFEQCFSDCMFKLSALVPDPRSFALAVDTGVIPASLMIDWPWWRYHVLATARHCANYYSPGHATQELFSDMRKVYRRYLHPTKLERWTWYIRRHPRYVACAIVLVMLLILVLIQTARGYHA